MIVTGVLPSGVALGPDGALTGTAAVSGTFVLELELCDDGAPVACVLRPLTITVDEIVGNTPAPPLTPASPDQAIPETEAPGPIELAELPFTGLETHGLLALAMALLGAGVVLLRVGRSEPELSRRLRSSRRSAVEGLTRPWKRPAPTSSRRESSSTTAASSRRAVSRHRSG